MQRSPTLLMPLQRLLIARLRIVTLEQIAQDIKKRHSSLRASVDLSLFLACGDQILIEVKVVVLRGYEIAVLLTHSIALVAVYVVTTHERCRVFVHEVLGTAAAVDIAVILAVLASVRATGDLERQPRWTCMHTHAHSHGAGH